MEVQKDMPTNAFKKYIDHIALIHSNLFFYMPRKKVEGLHLEVSLDTYLDELYLRSAICCKTADDISAILPFEEVKSQYNLAVLELSKQDLDLIEFRTKKENLDKQLLTYAKLEYCIQKYLNEPNLNNDTVIACILVTILDKLNKQTNEVATKHVSISRTKLFKYLKEVSIEEDEFDFKTAYEKKSVNDMIERLFNAIVVNNFEFETTTEETMLGVDKKNYIVQLGVICPEIENDKSFADYKQDFEDDVYEWMIEQMHTLEDGRVF